MIIEHFDIDWILRNDRYEPRKAVGYSISQSRDVGYKNDHRSFKADEFPTQLVRVLFAIGGIVFIEEFAVDKFVFLFVDESVKLVL